MNPWTIYDFVSPERNEIRVWLDRLPKKAGAKIDVRLRYLETTQLWPEQYISALTGCDDIYELKIVSGGVQYRPLGFYGPGRQEFTLVVGAVEKGGRLKPPAACPTAQQRMETVYGDRNRIVQHQY